MRFRSLLAAVFSLALICSAQSEDLWKQAAEQMRAGDYTKAKQTLDKISGPKPRLTSAYIALGSAHFYSKQYAESVKAYDKAYELESGASGAERLNQTYHRVLVDQLGMALGISGELKRSKELFEKEIQSDPDYPLYRYNLACGFGEEGDMEGALTHLRAAWERRKNMIGGEEFPNPRQDSSFKRFLGNPKFQAALKEMGY